MDTAGVLPRDLLVATRANWFGNSCGVGYFSCFMWQVVQGSGACARFTIFCPTSWQELQALFWESCPRQESPAAHRVMATPAASRVNNRTSASPVNRVTPTMPTSPT